MPDAPEIRAAAPAPAAATPLSAKPSRAERKRRSREKEGNGVVETIKTVAYALLIALTVRSFAYEPFSIPSRSMLPTLEVGDYLFVSKFSYGYSALSSFYGFDLFEGRLLASQPERGDVAVFKLPSDPRQDYIKRVIGLPGDKVAVTAGELYINGTKVPRELVGPYTDDLGQEMQRYVETLPVAGSSTGRRHNIVEVGDRETHDDFPEVTVPPGHYFMMGDNRDNSLDSRVTPSPMNGMIGVGFVPAENLVGRAEFIFFSLEAGTAFYELWKWPWALRPERMFEAAE